MQANFRSFPLDRAAFENVPSVNLQHKPAWNILFGGAWRKPLDISREEGKAYVMGLRRACRSNESLGKKILFLPVNMDLVLSASKGRGSAPNLNHSCLEICVISLVTFTIPASRWIAPEDNAADEPPRSRRYRADMHHDVDQRGTSAAEVAADTELFAVLSAEAARMASDEASVRNPSGIRSSSGLACQNRGARREESGRVRTRVFDESSFLEQNRVPAATVQRYTDTLAEFLAFA